MKTSFFVKILNSWELIFLGIFGFLTRFFSLAYLNKVVFDEAHFGLYATKYFSHQYFFDIHPPLGKLLLALSGFLGKIKSGFDFTVNSDYGDFNFLALRLLPALFGSLLIILIYLFIREIGFSRKVAFLSGFLLLFDNALIVQSRFILLDVILLFFILLSFYLFVLAKKTLSLSSRWYLLHILCGLALGAAISIKWTGFGILGIVWFLTIFDNHLFSKPKKELLLRVIFLLLVPVVFYFLIFAIHFSLLPSACTENCGAVLDPFLKQDSKAYFNNPPSGNLFTKFIEVNRLILASNLSNSAMHYHQSDWYSWPFLVRPIQYFREAQDGKTSFIYFLGNPLVWWFGLIGLLSYFYLIIKNYLFKFKLKLPASFYSKGAYLLVLGYFVYFIPFFAVERFMLIYHYLPALVFSVIIFSLLVESFKSNILFFVILILVFLTFIYFLPLTYGLPLTEAGLQSRLWLPTWSF